MEILKARESQDSHSDIIARTEALNEVGAGIPSSAAQMSAEEWKEKHLRKLAIIDHTEKESIIDVRKIYKENFCS